MTKHKIKILYEPTHTDEKLGKNKQKKRKQKSRKNDIFIVQTFVLRKNTTFLLHIILPFRMFFICNTVIYIDTKMQCTGELVHIRYSSTHTYTQTIFFCLQYIVNLMFGLSVSKCIKHFFYSYLYCTKIYECEEE